MRRIRKTAVVVITLIAFLFATVSPVLYAFGEKKNSYILLFVLGFAWCAAFVYANNRKEE